MFLILLSFVAGLLTVLAPCVLPLLPVIIGGSIAGERSPRRATTIVVSLSVSVFAFTLLLKASTLLISIPQSFWTWLSGGILIVFGAVTLFPSLWEAIPLVSRLNRKANLAVGAGYMKSSLWGDMLIGAALGPVFATCSPTFFVVLATVLPQSFLAGSALIVIYVLGLGLALSLIALLGQRLVGKLSIAADPHGPFKRVIGAAFILVGIVIITGLDKRFQIAILDAGFFDVTKIEQKLLERGMKDVPLDPTRPVSQYSLEEKAARFAEAKELVSPSGFVNTGGAPITVEEFRGKKVVLLDIWTYSCINCRRTIPYLNAWYDKYEDDGLVIIGLHTPEFAFEQLIENVEKAVKDFGIRYPVVLDNEYATWNAYGNRYWPRKYLIDLDGFIVYSHIGEGAYAETEQAIRDALLERSERLGIPLSAEGSVGSPEGTYSSIARKVESPEIYFGAWRNHDLANGIPGREGVQTLSLPATPEKNLLYLGGAWDFSREYAETAGTESRIVFRFSAKDVYMVARSDEEVEVEVLLDGKPIGMSAGADVGADGIMRVKEDRMYSIIEGEGYGEHVLELIIRGAGLEAYTFTFG